MTNYQPELSAGLGLIFRLNALWEKSDRAALTGNLDSWELILDRIYSNLLYRDDIEITKDDDGEITDVKLSYKDVNVWKKLKAKIRIACGVWRKSKTKQEFSRNKIAWYHEIMIYDIYLRLW